MRYLILIHSNPEAFAALTDEQRASIDPGHQALHEAIVESGEYVAGEGLAGPERGKRITVTGGETVVRDGPFAEAKEHLAGFIMVDVESEARAIEIAARVPDAAWGAVELRPVLDLSHWDL